MDILRKCLFLLVMLLSFMGHKTIGHNVVGGKNG